MKETKNLLVLSAITSAHVGSGDVISTIDLPIQREKHTNYPTIFASSIKGAFRNHYRKARGEKKDINLIFGTDKQDLADKDSSENNPSLISFSDARILFFPMRSSESPFILVTCPYVIKRFLKDIELILDRNKIINNIPRLNNEIEIINEDEAIVLSGDSTNDSIIVEEAFVRIINDAEIEDIKKIINVFNSSIKDKKIFLISDSMFDYCVTCTEIQTNIKIDVEKGTAQDGSLRYQEFLPSESVLYSIVWFGNENTNETQENIIEKSVKDAIGNFIQIGGDETLGKGIFEINWYNENNIFN